MPGTHWYDVDYTTTVEGGDLAVWARQFGQGVAPPPAAAAVAASVSSATESATAMVISAPSLESRSEPLSAPSPLPASRFAVPASVILAAPAERPASKKSGALHPLKRDSTSPRDAAFAALASPTTVPLGHQRMQLQSLNAAPPSDAPHAEFDAALYDEFVPSAIRPRVAP